jgi:hypothetical protein
VRDEVETSEHCIQPHSDLKSLQPDTRVLVIILDVEAMFIGGHQVVFEECFQNTNEGQMVSHLFDKIGHRLWLQGPLNHLGNERRANYIGAILRKILDFLHV